MAGTPVYDKAFIVNVNKCLKPFFREQHINIVNKVTLQSIWLICNLTNVMLYFDFSCSICSVCSLSNSANPWYYVSVDAS